MNNKHGRPSWIFTVTAKSLMGPAVPQRAGEPLHEEGFELIGLITADDGLNAQSFIKLDWWMSEANLYALIPEEFKWLVTASPAPASPAPASPPPPCCCRMRSR